MNEYLRKRKPQKKVTGSLPAPSPPTVLDAVMSQVASTDHSPLPAQENIETSNSWAKVVYSQLRALPYGQRGRRSLTGPAQMMSLPWAYWATSLSCSEKKIHTIHNRVETLNETMSAECPQSRQPVK